MMSHDDFDIQVHRIVSTDHVLVSYL